MVVFGIALCMIITLPQDYLKDIEYVRRSNQLIGESRENHDAAGYTLRQTNEARLLLGGMIKLYQIFVSPQGPPGCNYTATCSQFMARAVRDHGIFHGIFMTADRLDRCIHSARRYYPTDMRTGRAIDHPVGSYYLPKKGRRLDLP